MTNYTPPKNDLWGQVKYGLKNIFRASQDAVGQFYQVKVGDTSVGGIAQNLGVSLNDFVSANGGMKTLPPVGTMISTGIKGQLDILGREAQFAGAVGEAAARSSPSIGPFIQGAAAVQNLAFPGVKSMQKGLKESGKPVPGMTGEQAAAAWQAQYASGGPGTSNDVNSFMSGGTINVYETASYQAQQLAAGTPPASISYLVQKANGWTDADMLATVDPATGQPIYKYDNITKSWKLQNPTGGSADKPPDPYSEVRSVALFRDNGRVKYVTPEEANLRRKAQNRRRDERVVAAPDAANAANTPTTTIDVRIGSG